MPPMKKNHLPDALRRLLQFALAAWLVTLGGCGPGTGGTGTGPQGSSTFIVGPTLGMAPPMVIGPVAGVLRSDCGSACPPAVLQLDPLAVELKSQCVRFFRQGEWAVDGIHAELQGTLETTRSSGVQVGAGTLRLQFTTDPDASPIVAVTLLDDAGRTVLGPQVLQRAENTAARPATPCN
jgi:hypothetical protein